MAGMRSGFFFLRGSRGRMIPRQARDTYGVERFIEGDESLFHERFFVKKNFFPRPPVWKEGASASHDGQEAFAE